MYSTIMKKRRRCIIRLRSLTTAGWASTSASLNKYKYEIQEASEEDDDNPLKINLTLWAYEPPETPDTNFSLIANFSENLTKEESESCISNKKSSSSNSIEKKKKKRKFRKATKRSTNKNLEEWAKVYSKSPLEKANPRKWTVDTQSMLFNDDYGQDFTSSMYVARAKSSSLYQSYPAGMLCPNRLLVHMQKNSSYQSNKESLPQKQDMLNIIDSLKELEETLFAEESDE